MVRAMTLSDVIDQLDYWSDIPCHGDMLQIIAMGWGWKPKKARAAKPTQARSILADFPNGR
jgi:hypothetical protein